MTATVGGLWDAMLSEGKLLIAGRYAAGPATATGGAPDPRVVGTVEVGRWAYRHVPAAYPAR
jgi:hypothetical protein